MESVPTTYAPSGSPFRLAIFDLDGVLVETEYVHTRALRGAVRWVVGDKASEEPYLSAGDGIRTKDKLKRLQSVYGFDDSSLALIDEIKFSRVLHDIGRIGRNSTAVACFRHLDDQGVQIAIASNSRRAFVYPILEVLGVLPFCDAVLCGDELAHPKPDPEIYFRLMNRLAVFASRTVIFEDSDIGVEGAEKTGAVVVRVDPKKLLQLEDVLSAQQLAKGVA